MKLHKNYLQMFYVDYYLGAVAHNFHDNSKKKHF